MRKIDSSNFNGKREERKSRETSIAIRTKECLSLCSIASSSVAHIHFYVCDVSFFSRSAADVGSLHFIKRVIYTIIIFVLAITFAVSFRRFVFGICGRHHFVACRRLQMANRSPSPLSHTRTMLCRNYSIVAGIFLSIFVYSEKLANKATENRSRCCACPWFLFMAKVIFFFFILALFCFHREIVGQTQIHMRLLWTTWNLLFCLVEMLTLSSPSLTSTTNWKWMARMVFAENARALTHNPSSMISSTVLDVFLYHFNANFAVCFDSIVWYNYSHMKPPNKLVFHNPPLLSVCVCFGFDWHRSAVGHRNDVKAIYLSITDKTLNSVDFDCIDVFFFLFTTKLFRSLNDERNTFGQVTHFSFIAFHFSRSHSFFRSTWFVLVVVLSMNSFCTFSFSVRWWHIDGWFYIQRSCGLFIAKYIKTRSIVTDCVTVI